VDHDIGLPEPPIGRFEQAHDRPWIRCTDGEGFGASLSRKLRQFVDIARCEPDAEAGGRETARQRSADARAGADNQCDAVGNT
jgi:hypothetical protein